MNIRTKTEPIGCAQVTLAMGDYNNKIVLCWLDENILEHTSLFARSDAVSWHFKKVLKLDESSLQTVESTIFERNEVEFK